MELFKYYTFLILFSYGFAQKDQEEGALLSSKLRGVIRPQSFDWQYPLRWLQYLPNPAHHGFEKRAGSGNDPFQPQKECTYRFENLTAGSSGVITSPSYPKNYAPGLRCQWRIESEPGTVVRLTFFDVVTQPWFLFFYDYLAVSLNGKWDQFYRLTGDMNRFAPMNLESTGNHVGIRFTSGFDFFNYRGFKMGYVVVRRAVLDEGNVTATNATGGSVNYGNSSDVSAICDYSPITLPPDSIGDTPLQHQRPRIVGGLEAIPHEFPFVVAMIMDDTKFCSGSLINPGHVLTAAHCIPEDTRKLELYFGVHDMRRDEDSRQYDVVNPKKNVVRHPSYDPVTAIHDIAIVKLNRRIRTDAFVQPVYLPTAHSLGNSFVGWNLTTMGWGDDILALSGGDQHPITPVLQKAVMPVISTDECRKSFRHLITGNMMCTRVATAGAPCRGDSGAPLVARFSRSPNTAEEVPAVVNDDNQLNQCYFTKSHRDRVYQEKTRPLRNTEWFVQLGVLSFGAENCGSKTTPVTFSRVTAYLDFINEIVPEEKY